MKVSGLIGIAMLIAGQPVAAQTVVARGWPEAPATATAAPAKPEPKPAAAPARPAPVTKAPAVRPAAARPAAATANPAAADTVKSEPAAAPAVMSPSTLPELLQQQSALLARLAAELDQQRATIAEQQKQIQALELARTGALSAPAPAPAPAKTAAPPPPAITVETGGIKLKMSGLFQGWYTATVGPAVDSFRLRRTELKFSGDMSSRVKWALMFDAAKALSLATTSTTVGGQQVLTSSSVGQGSRVLQDAFASVVLWPALTIDVGQQKLPLSMEGMQSSGRLDTIERALFMSDKARGGGYGDVRDLGLMARGKVAGGQVEYFAGVFNGLGESQNDLDKNDQKNVAARIVFRPAFVKGLQLGGSFARDGFATGLEPAARERHGAEFVYTRSRFGIKSEVMAGRDGRLSRRGGYVQASQKVHRNVQAIFRFDSWDPDTRANATPDTVAEHDWLGGVTYSIANTGAWLQFNYVRKTFAEVLPARNVFIANIQSTW